MPRPSMKKSRTLVIALLVQQPLGTVCVQLIVQSLKTNAEQFCRTCLIVAGLFERAENHLALDFFERRPDWKGYRVLSAQPLPLIERIRGEVMPLYLFTRTNDYGTLNDVTQLAHVSRP